jgi:hypothetical protein
MNKKIRYLRKKHQKLHWRIGLTIGLVTVTAISLVVSFHPAVPVISGCCLNLIWLWEV